MAFHCEYFEVRRGAVKRVMHGDRIESSGDIRLEPIPIPDNHEVLMSEYGITGLGKSKQRCR